MKKNIAISLFINAIIYFFSYSFNAFSAEDASIAASVNNKVVSSYDVVQRYNFIVNYTKIKIESDRDYKALINQIVDKIIDEELIRQESEKLSISVTDKEIDSAIETSLSSQGKINYDNFKKGLISKNVSIQSFRDQIKTDLLWSKIISESLKSKIRISDQEIKEFLEQQKLDISQTKYFIAEIFIRNSLEAEILSNKIYKELNNGGNFKSFVKQFSSSHSQENNGEIGWISKSDVNEKIYDSIKNLEINSYSEPVFIADGYYIFKLIKKKNVSELKENDINYARNRIFIRELETESKKYLMELRKKSFIERYKI